MGVHTNLDPITGGCLDCGARREEIDDNLFPVCEKVVGPHRLAIIALGRILRERQGSAYRMRRAAEASENAAVEYSRASRRSHAEAEAIAASAAMLRSLSPQPESPSRVMQRAADAILDPPRS